MDKRVLEEYIDACALVEETEKELKKLEKRGKTVVQDSVKASMHDFPYAETRMHVAGIEYKVLDNTKKRNLEVILKERKNKAEKVKIKVEEWINDIPVRMQRIVKYKFFEGYSWEGVAQRIGRNATGESIRKEFDKFLKENEN